MAENEAVPGISIADIGGGLQLVTVDDGSTFVFNTHGGHMKPVRNPGNHSPAEVLARMKGDTGTEVAKALPSTPPELPATDSEVDAAIQFKPSKPETAEPPETYADARSKAASSAWQDSVKRDERNRVLHQKRVKETHEAGQKAKRDQEATVEE